MQEEKREKMKKKKKNNNNQALKSQCHPKCFVSLYFCFETAFCVWLGAFAGLFTNYTMLHWPFSELISTVVDVVASENENIFIARCYWRKQR